MKLFRKSLMAVLSVFAFCLVLGSGMRADALEAAPAKSMFRVDLVDVKSKSISIDVDNETLNYYEVQICDAAKKPIRSMKCITYASFSGIKKLKNNRLYYYRIRRLSYDAALKTDVPATEWSAFRAFATAKYTVKNASKKNTSMYFKMPKISGVKDYTLYISEKSRSKGFKKVAVIKPGKSKTIAKFQNKAFKIHKDYYVKIVPNLKKKATVDPFVGYFYLLYR